MNESYPPIDPKTTALLVMDYQQAILGMLPSSEPLLKLVVEAIDTTRAAGAYVGYVRVAFDDADYDRVPAHSRFSAILTAFGRAFHSDAPETAVHADVAPRHGDIVVRKTRVGAFSTTDLDRQLKERGITTLLLAGISTSGVVLSTVRDAADRDYQIFVIADACADRDPAVHDFLVGKVLPSQAHIIHVADLAPMLTGAAAP